MACIACLVKTGSTGDLSGSIEEICRFLSFGRLRAVRTESRGTVALGGVYLDYEPSGGDFHVCDDGMVWVALAGYVVPDDGEGGKEVGGAEAAAALYLQFGEGFVDRLCGSFSIVLYDAREGKIFAVSDRFGTRPLYYLHTSEGLVICSALRGFLGVDGFCGKPDRVASVQSILCHHPLGDRTLLKGVRLLAAGSVLKYDVRRGTVQVSSYWRPDLRPEQGMENISVRVCAERLADSLRAAVRRLVQKFPCLALCLSGGFDSRLLAGCLSQCHARFVAYTFGEADTNEGRIARLVADRLHAVHRWVPYTLERFVEGIPKAVWLTDGLAVTGEYLCLLEDIGRDGLPAVLGFGGDVLSGRRSFAPERLPAERSALERAVFRQVASAVLPLNEAASFFVPEVWREARERLESEYWQPARQTHVTDPAAYYTVDQLLNRQRRWTCPVLTAGYAYSMPLLPYVDCELVDAFFGLPAHCRENQAAYQAMVDICLADLKWLGTTDRAVPVLLRGLAEPYYRTRRFLFNRVLSRYAWKYVERYVTNPVAAINCGSIFRERYGEWCRETILDSPLTGSLWRRSQAERVLSDHLSGRRNRTRLVQKMLAAEYFRRIFLERQYPNS